jgi:hypothetical protein
MTCLSPLKDYPKTQDASVSHQQQIALCFTPFLFPQQKTSVVPTSANAVKGSNRDF